MAMMSTSIPQRQTKTRDGTAVRERGQERVANILAAARSILINEGIASLTTRRVAKDLGISVGNLAYYFSSKEALLQALIEDVRQGYDEELERESHSFPDDPPQRFKAFLRYMIDDARKPEVRSFFYQLWGLSTHSAWAATSREQMYRHFAEQTVLLLEPIHPVATASELRALALVVLTNLEGLHVVYGSGDKLLKQGRGFDTLIYRHILNLVGIEE
ncbi:MAG: TetR/AcrR family transcriptional regulator [Gammaproteobacteria bacterium]|nr:TetR/AcrR family transcriptional regulator [Gammaproteobacteria bacterium]